MIGQFARSIAGHDKNEIYVIVGIEDNYVLISDGRLKPLSNPKKKNSKHLQILKRDCDSSLKEKILNNDKAVNEAIKRAIKLYKREDKNV